MLSQSPSREPQLWVFPPSNLLLQLLHWTLPSRTPWTPSTAGPTTGGTWGSPSTPGAPAVADTRTRGGARAVAAGPGTDTGGPGPAVTAGTGGGPGLGPGPGPGPGTGETVATAGTGETTGGREATPGTEPDLGLRAAADLADWNIFRTFIYPLQYINNVNWFVPCNTDFYLNPSNFSRLLKRHVWAWWVPQTSVRRGQHDISEGGQPSLQDPPRGRRQSLWS